MTSSLERFDFKPTGDLVVKYQVTREAYRDTYFVMRHVIRQRLVRDLRLAGGTGRIIFRAMRIGSLRLYEFVGFLGPNAVQYGRSYRRHRIEEEARTPEADRWWLR